MTDNFSLESLPELQEDTRVFLASAIKSQLVKIEDLRRIMGLLHAEGDDFSSKHVAKAFVHAGALSHWQSEQLRRGKKRGFFLGDFLLRKPLGRGGQCVVYLATHQIMKRSVALKILPADETSKAAVASRFQREARIASQLNHPNVVCVYEFGVCEKKSFLAMEYVEGGNLHEAVKRGGAMSYLYALEICHQVAIGLAHVHERNIVHRDLKPTNILLSTDGAIKIIDMGLAKAENDEFEGLDPSRLLGTADYVAPEQIVNSSGVDARADLYALGCTLYFLLTGQPPFPDDDVDRQLAKHQVAEIPDVRAIRSDCPTGLVDLLSRMMAKQPEQRPRSASELLRQIKHVRTSIAERHEIDETMPPGETLFDG
ncbi:serine/threonine-protein kinase [Planctomycetes bacterium K23_9]|uniref:Serine/threonine-protein kinase PknH n=1 Tax=Stieleria marina TaxID=1930275 RepID=A0A517NQQ6_9BACT|nr:Serine/threonine-protein kinase PknH [Planctomycetes bacterium K23_9]